MLYLQVLLNGLVLGGLYACIAAGFSLVWGVLNVINILHGTFIVIGSYAAYFAYVYFDIHPLVSIPIAAVILFFIGYALQSGVINKVVAAPVLTTLTLTFGLDLFLNNLLIVAFKADYRKVTLENPLGDLSLSGITVPIDRLAAMALALLLTGLAFLGPGCLASRASHSGRAHGPGSGGAHGGKGEKDLCSHFCHRRGHGRSCR